MSFTRRVDIKEIIYKNVSDADGPNSTIILIEKQP